MDYVITESHYHSIKTENNELLFNFHASERVGVRRFGAENEHIQLCSTLSLVESGSGVFYLGQKAIPIKAGDLILIRCNEPHCLCIDNDKGPIYISYVSFHLSSILPVAAEWIDSRLTDIFIYDNDDFYNKFDDNEYADEIKRLILEIKAELLRDKPNYYAAKSKFLTIIARVIDLVGSEKKITKQESTRNIDIVWESVEYIRSHMTEDLSVELIAQESNMDVSYFSKIFKSVLGLSPWNYIIHSRIDLAMSYLRDEKAKYSITDIASMSGFSNLSNFNRTFKKIVGMTPSEFRKQHR